MCLVKVSFFSNGFHFPGLNIQCTIAWWWHSPQTPPPPPPMSSPTPSASSAEGLSVVADDLPPPAVLEGPFGSLVVFRNGKWESIPLPTSTGTFRLQEEWTWSIQPSFGEDHDTSSSSHRLIMTLVCVQSHDEEKAREQARAQSLVDLETNFKIVEEAKMCLDNPESETKKTPDEAKEAYDRKWKAASDLYNFLETPNVLFQVQQKTLSWVICPGEQFFDSVHGSTVQWVPHKKPVMGEVIVERRAPVLTRWYDRTDRLAGWNYFETPLAAQGETALAEGRSFTMSVPTRPIPAFKGTMLSLRNTEGSSSFFSGDHPCRSFKILVTTRDSRTLAESGLQVGMLHRSFFEKKDPRHLLLSYDLKEGKCHAPFNHHAPTAEYYHESSFVRTRATTSLFIRVALKNGVFTVDLGDKRFAKLTLATGHHWETMAIPFVFLGPRKKPALLGSGRSRRGWSKPAVKDYLVSVQSSTL